MAGTERHTTGPAEKFRKQQKRALIMVVESNDSVGEMICTIIAEETDYELRWVKDAESFVRAIDEGCWPPDLILMDIDYLVAEYKQQLKSIITEGKDTPPMIMMSGWSQAHMQEAIKHINPGNLIVKPFEVQTLLDTIHTVLQNRAARKEIRSAVDKSAIDTDLVISSQSNMFITH